ncbi:MAG: S24 family peptidase [bacterium]|nr:S24 family peptidase [bacterium]
MTEKNDFVKFSTGVDKILSIDYNIFMHIIQEKLLKLISENNIGALKLREIGELVGVDHPQKIKHHLQMLVDKGLVKLDKKNKIIKKITDSVRDSQFVSIPIVGAADCGPASIVAENNIEGYLKLSSKLIKRKKGLFALKAVGSSMNKANIKGQSIQDGDYVIVDSEDKTPGNKDYIVSIIDNTANIKKIFIDQKRQEVVLSSESTQDFPPIYIHPNEVSYHCAGKVIQVVKKPDNG